MANLLGAGRKKFRLASSTAKFKGPKIENFFAMSLKHISFKTLPYFNPASWLKLRGRQYSALVQEHFTNPRNVGSFVDTDPSIGTAIVGKAACGDVIKLQVQVKENRIEDVKFKAFGCGSAIASSSLASELIKGLSLDEARSIKNTDIAKALSLPPVKLHCSLLAEDAIKRAIDNYREKQNTPVETTTRA